MKMRPDHYARLEDMIRAVESKYGTERLQSFYAELADDPRVKDRDKRYRWDLFYATVSRDRWALMDETYGYLDDSHIDTALRRIVSAP